MNNTYENLNTVTLYKTPQFSSVDTVLFKNLIERDSYFNTLPSEKRLEITEFTDLYEGRNFVLPYNYLDLKEYNTMKLYYNDGLGHEQTYYCNVDNYIYVSTNACIPIYRIDYFLTFGYLIYDKNINIVMDRRTVKESEINRDMKSDDIQIPRLQYHKYNSWSIPVDGEEYYIAFLNKTTENVGKNGINCSIGFYENDSERIGYHEIDTFTIGCYIAFTSKANISKLLNKEPQEYIEKIVEWNVPRQMWGKFETVEKDGIFYVNSDWQIDYNNDFVQVPIKYDSYDNFNVLTYADVKDEIQPTHNKKILNWLNSKGCVIQGNEFDFKDFDNEDFVIPLDENNPAKLNSTIYIYNIFGYTFAYPLGYKGEKINLDYSLKWQSARNFSYSSNYTKTLAYRERLDYNNQSIINANRTAGIESYYANQLAKNSNEQLDISKRQTGVSYASQLSSMNNTYQQALISGNGQYSQLLNAGQLYGITGWVPFATGLISGTTQKTVYDREIQKNIVLASLQNNAQALNSQSQYLDIQRQLSYLDIDSKKQANLISASYKCDMASATRDNAIANISISNKYNNAKPNAYNETDFTQFTTYFYIFTIDTDNNTNFRIVDNIKAHYNVLGTNVGYIENWKPSERKGLYFDYVLGSVIDNKNSLFKDLTPELYTELVTRIENGIRMWYTDTIEWFGDVIIDNTYTGSAEPYLENLTNERKVELTNIVNNKIYNELVNKNNLLEYILVGEFNPAEKTYMNWLVNDLVWGETPVEATKRTMAISEVSLLDIRFNRDLAKVEARIREWTFLTIYEMQEGIRHARYIHQNESEVVNNGA